MACLFSVCFCELNYTLSPKKPVNLTACRFSQSGALLCLVEFYPVKVKLKIRADAALTPIYAQDIAYLA